jgi:hypothetical protein
MRLLPLLAFVFAAAGANAAPATDITLANWLKHPQVVAVRAIFEAVNADKTLRSDEKVGCDGNTSRRVNKANVIRSVTETGGEGGIEGRTEAWYDEHGVLRFLISTTIDEAGTADDLRVYLDEHGKVFWQVARHGTAKDGRADFSAARFELAKAPFDAKAWADARVAFERTGCAEQP